MTTINDERLAQWLLEQREKAAAAMVAAEARRKATEERKAREAAERLERAIESFPEAVKPYCTKRTSISGAWVELPGLPAFVAWKTDGGGFGFYIPYVSSAPNGNPIFTQLTDRDALRIFGEWYAAIEVLQQRQAEFDALMPDKQE